MFEIWRPPRPNETLVFNLVIALKKIRMGNEADAVQQAFVDNVEFKPDCQEYVIPYTLNMFEKSIFIDSNIIDSLYPALDLSSTQIHVYIYNLEVNAS